MIWAAPHAGFDPFFDEDDIRRQSGPSVFAQADEWERTGHVLSIERTADALIGRVRGTWRRVDSVTIQTRGNRLRPECERHGPGFCPHVGALLLHALREPSSIAVADPFPVYADDVSHDTDASYEAMLAPATPVDELESFLMDETIAAVRVLADRRGVQVSGHLKADVVHAAALGLADPANIAAALAGLSSSERLLLDAVYLSSARGASVDTRAFSAYRQLGGDGEPPLARLRDLGLVICRETGYDRGQFVRVPTAVIAQLSPRDGLASAAPGGESAADFPRGLGLVALLAVIAHDERVGRRTIPNDGALSPYSVIPRGFVVHPDDIERVPAMMRSYDPRERIRLIATPVMADVDSQRIARQSGWPSEVVVFVGRLIVALGISSQEARLTVRPEMVRRFLGWDAPTQWELLTRGWMRTAGVTAASRIFDDGGPMRFAWNPRHAAPKVNEALEDGVALIARLVSRMQVGAWFDIAPFCETVERLIPSCATLLATFRQSSRYLDLISNAESQSAQQVILDRPDGWSLFVRAIVDATLGGPLHWLGHVDAALDAGHVTAFQVRPSAAILTGRPFDISDVLAPGAVRVSDDLTIVVPVGSPSVARLGPILQVSPLTQVAPDGLHYQLGPTGSQALFEQGLDADDVAQLLEAVTGSPIPVAAQATLDCWQASYGQVRLYDELTVIELGDDLLLRELQAATSLERVTIHQFSPRLIAVDDRDVESLIQELSARGYTPHIVDGC